MSDPSETVEAKHRAHAIATVASIVAIIGIAAVLALVIAEQGLLRHPNSDHVAQLRAQVQLVQSQNDRLTSELSRLRGSVAAMRRTGTSSLTSADMGELQYGVGNMENFVGQYCLTFQNPTLGADYDSETERALVEAGFAACREHNGP